MHTQPRKLFSPFLGKTQTCRNVFRFTARHVEAFFKFFNVNRRNIFFLSKPAPDGPVNAFSSSSQDNNCRGFFLQQDFIQLLVCSSLGIFSARCRAMFGRGFYIVCSPFFLQDGWLQRAFEFGFSSWLTSAPTLVPRLYVHLCTEIRTCSHFFLRFSARQTCRSLLRNFQQDGTAYHIFLFLFSARHKSLLKCFSGSKTLFSRFSARRWSEWSKPFLAIFSHGHTTTETFPAVSGQDTDLSKCFPFFSKTRRNLFRVFQPWLAEIFSAVSRQDSIRRSTDLLFPHKTTNSRRSFLQQDFIQLLIFALRLGSFQQDVELCFWRGFVLVGSPFLQDGLQQAYFAFLLVPFTSSWLWLQRKREAASLFWVPR